MGDAARMEGVMAKAETRRRPGRPRGTTSRITVARLPEDARGQVPNGLTGEPLADWYLTWDAGRRYAQEQLAPLARVVERLEGLAATLEYLARPAGAGTRRPPVSGSAPEPAAPEPYDWEADDGLDEPGYVREPDVPDGVALPATEYQMVLDWIRWAEAQAVRPRDVTPAVVRVLQGHRFNPATQTNELDPPWTTLPGRWKTTLYARLAQSGILPAVQDDVLHIPAERPDVPAAGD